MCLSLSKVFRDILEKEFIYFLNFPHTAPILTLLETIDPTVTSTCFNKKTIKMKYKIISYFTHHITNILVIVPKKTHLFCIIQIFRYLKFFLVVNRVSKEVQSKTSDGRFSLIPGF